MKLRSIPRRRAPSSMRAADRIGMTFVGRRISQPVEEPFTPRIIAPDPAVAAARERWHGTLASLAQRFETLRDTAEEIAERDLWNDALERLSKGNNRQGE